MGRVDGEAVGQREDLLAHGVEQRPRQFFAPVVTQQVGSAERADPACAIS